MIQVRETTRTLPFYRPVPLTGLPLIYHREHLFPYPSYGDTEPSAAQRAFRMVVLENEFLRVEVAPELGGRVYSLFDKRLGREVLFSNPVVKPVRVLPVWGFISGGIEFNFPIAHSPTSIAEVGCVSGIRSDYAFVRVGEREARTGMEWVVELGLLENVPLLIQRNAFRNQTPLDHPWMSWTICAVRSTAETEFLHPPHRVLVHNHTVNECDWPGAGLNWDRNYRNMTALFWKPGSAPAFGVFHHDLGFGLMHLADPARLPGKKVWTYGHGPHRPWGQATTEGGFSYAEIESGPLLDQSEKPLFPRGTEHRSQEYWVPVHSPADCAGMALPDIPLPPLTDPWPGWRHSPWQTEWELFRAGEGPWPSSIVPTGLELEAALQSQLDSGDMRAAEPLALWLAFRGHPAEALDVLTGQMNANCHRIRGLILWKAVGLGSEAAASLERGPLHDPLAVVELDTLYSELGWTAKRANLLAQAPAHRLVVERQADLALIRGQPAEAIRLLKSVAWPREHQRYVRTDLWRRAKEALAEEPATESPALLGEDNLAPFGAYWSDD